MSTVRIQVRRGTASQWTSVNPILAAGEMGVESDTNLFKFGNGSSTWTALAYANNSDVAIGEISQDAINAALVVGDGLTKTYNDGANTITIAVADSYFTELAQDAVNTATVAGTGITKSYNDSTNELTLSVDTYVIANKNYVDTAVSALSNTVDLDYIPVTDRGNAGGVASLNNSGKVPTSELDIDNTVITLIDSTVISGRGVNATWDNATNKEVLSAGIRAQGGIVKTDAEDNQDIILSLSPTITATTKFAGPLVQVDEVQADVATLGELTVSGNLTVSGTTTTVNSTNYSVADPMLYIGEDNQSNALDLGIVGAFNNGTYQHSGIVRDASDGIWKLFSGVISEPTTTIDFTTYTKDNLEVGGLIADVARIGNVVNAEIQNLAGVDSPIQEQLDDKLAISEAATTYAPIASPTFTGTVTLPSGTVTSEMILNGTIADADINEYAEIAQSKVANLVNDLANKAPKLSPTFLGSVVLPTDTTIGDISATELGYVNGVTSGIQYQIDTVSNNLAAKVTSYDSSIEDLFTSTSTLTSDLNAAENDISALESDVEAINTTASDLQTQINAKAASTALASHASDTTDVHGIADTSALALTADVNTALDLKAPIDSPTFTGTVAGITKTMVGLGNADNTTDAEKPISTATQTALDAKLNLAGGTMTGTLTLSGAPSSSLHAATKQYVDNTASGIVAKPQVLGATTANLDATYNNGTAGVGATLTHNTNGVFPAGAGGAEGWAVGKGILVKDQTNKAQNGRYYISDMGSPSTPYVLTRCGYCDEASEIPGAYIFVQDGTNAGTGWVQTVADATTFTVGTDNINVVQFSGSGTITAGTNISVSGNDISVVNAPTFSGAVTASSGIVFSDGTQTKIGVPSITTIATAISSSATLAAGEQDKFVPLSGAVVITLPATGYSNGQSIDFWQQTGTGAAFASTNGVIGTPGLKFRTTNSVVTAMKIASGWLVFGDLSA
jgi:hypothetical protein